MPKPLEIRPGEPLPRAHEVDWTNISEIHLFQEHPTMDMELRALLTVGVKNRVMPQGKTPEAVKAVDHFLA